MHAGIIIVVDTACLSCYILCFLWWMLHLSLHLQKYLSKNAIWNESLCVVILFYYWRRLFYWNEYKVMLKQYHYISNHLPFIIKILFVYKVPKYVKTMNELIFWWSFISNHVFHSFYTVKLKTLFKRFL